MSASTPERQKQLSGAGGFAFTDRDFREICSMLHEDAGIFLTEAKAPLVYSRLAKRLRALGLESFRDYCALVKSREGLDERQKMLAALTTNVTKFFREPHHFESLKKLVSQRVSAVRKGARLRLWSAACSNGQEPYSMAMTVLSVMPDAGDYDVRILATDIDPNMIEAGKAGVYDEEAMSAVPTSMKSRWFTPVEDVAKGSWAVSDELSSMVAFRELNLVGSWPFKGPFDAIFCRNVVIYFEEATQVKIWQRFTPMMTRHARLFIGHSERVSGPASADLVIDGVTTYKLRGGDDA
ncbi:MAG TPA: protein-glutamate O-methyltransferase CheR [Methylocystis sp.]|jgi:chemotaxis protein methyltransferase CheR